MWNRKGEMKEMKYTQHFVTLVAAASTVNRWYCWFYYFVHLLDIDGAIQFIAPTEWPSQRNWWNEVIALPWPDRQEASSADGICKIPQCSRTCLSFTDFTATAAEIWSKLGRGGTMEVGNNLIVSLGVGTPSFSLGRWRWFFSKNSAAPRILTTNFLF